MNPGSCNGKITERLGRFSWESSVNVSLFTHSVLVEFERRHDDRELAADVDGLGHAVTIEHAATIIPSSNSGLWSAAYAIEGMTCSSCVGTITHALTELPWVESANVNLLTNGATVILKQEGSHVDDVTAVIEDLGYGAKLSDAGPLKRQNDRDDCRTVSIRIDGMYCRHCPGRIQDAIARLDRPITVDVVPSTEHPIVTVTYSPRPPEFTIRDIICAILKADPAFQVRACRPRSLAECARQMQIRQRQRLVYRALLSAMTAIPTFIIGIVYLDLVPKSNSFRQYLRGKLGGVSRVEWALFILATPVYFCAADIFHRRTAKELYHLWKPSSLVPIARRFYRFGSMDMLLSLGTTIAYWASLANLIVAATRRGASLDAVNLAYFDSVVFLTLFLLLGRLIEAYTKAKTGEAVSMLGKLRPTEALLVLPDPSKEGLGRTESIDAHLIESGDVVRVLHGGSAPWDGVLLEIDGQFDESSLTGESRPVKKATGDPVYAGTVNLGASVSIRTTGASGKSMLDTIIRIVEEGQARRAPIERVADILTAYFVPFVTLVAVVTWLIWLSLGLSGNLPSEYMDTGIGGWPFWAVQFPVAVFVIACPCGIGLAAPTALFVGGGIAAKHGILMKGGGEAFEDASGLDVIVFDKTGTLTEGNQPQITDYRLLVANVGGWSEEALLTGLRDLENDSSHPLGRAMAKFCEHSNASDIQMIRTEELAGMGMKCSFSRVSAPQPTETMELIAGNETMMAEHDVSLDTAAFNTLHSWKAQAKSVVLVAARLSTAFEWTLFGIFAASDPLRPEAQAVVEAIGRQGVDVWLISGDNPTTARAVGAMVGIPPERIIGGVLPEQKAEKIKYLRKSQANGRRQGFFGRRRKKRATVAMVGDGINDSPALAVADVGIAIGSGSDVAISAAEVVLVNSNLRTLPLLITLSRAVFRRVKLNFAWAFVYNLAALPVAAGVLYPISSNGEHVRLGPVWASLAMALSSISVICSSLLLRSRLPFVGFRER